MNDPISEEAVNAVAEAIRYNDTSDSVSPAESWTELVEKGWHTAYLELARECLTAALPFIERQVRDEIAAEIEAKSARNAGMQRVHDWVSLGRQQGFAHAYREAARIARGGSA